MTRSSSEGHGRPDEIVIGAETNAPWHGIDFHAAIERLQTRPVGLTEAEAAERFKKYGPNRLTASKPRSAFVRFLAQ
ncbi:MAG: cation-transporting P-type ATPase, partial [Pseudolabrys sp.]|nr:cation-transporting P-type ATPase [Pseudolabrys sp.]